MDERLLHSHITRCSEQPITRLYHTKTMRWQDKCWSFYTLDWHHNERDVISNHQPHDCLLNRLFRHKSKKTSKLCVTGLCKGNSPVTGEFPAQSASNAENLSIWWHHHESPISCLPNWIIKFKTNKTYLSHSKLCLIASISTILRLCHISGNVNMLVIRKSIWRVSFDDS